MTKFTSVTAFLVKKVWLLLAILLVLFALLLSAARYALPHIEHNEHLLENYINERYGVSLEIDSVHAVWQRNGPSIVLNTVSLAQNEASPVALDIRQIYVEIDFWQSLAQRMISSNRFELRGLKLHIDATRLENAGDSDFPVVDALERLFLEQLQSFSLEEGELVVRRTDGEQSFDIERLTWNNRGQRHQGSGFAKVTGLSANSASFVIDITGTKDEFEGVMYAKADDLDISPWVSDLIATKQPLSESRANFEIWASINEKAITGVSAQVGESILQWGTSESKTVTGVRGGRIQLLPHNNAWNVRVDELIIDSNSETLVTDLVGQISNDGDMLINTVKPVQINPFLMLLPLFLDDTSEDEIRGLNPDGVLATVQLQLQNGSPQLAAKVLDFSWAQSDIIPGLSSLDAELYWYKNGGAVFLESVNSTLTADRLIKQNLDVNAFKADFYVYRESNIHSRPDTDEGDWVISGTNMLLDTNLVTVTPEFRLNTRSNELSIYSDIAPLGLANVSQLFPSKGMGENTDAYLTRAFTGKGDITNARILWHGKGKDFPFTDNSGVFQAFVDIKDSDFLFSPQWPALNELDLSLQFINDGLFMKSPGALLAGVEVSRLSADIPQLSKSSVLTINAHGDTDGDTLTQLMLGSSLEASLGKVLDKEVQVKGAISADLMLSIPFDGKPVRATGMATLDKNPVYITSTKMLFDNASGNIAFDNGNITSKKLSAQLLAQPVTLSFEGKQNDDYALSVDIKGRWHVHPLADFINNAFSDYVDGETAWATHVDLVFGQEDFSYKALLTADLEATQSVLPVPFDTASGTPLPLKINSEGNLQASTVFATLGEDIQFEGVLPHKEMQFSRAHLSLGQAELTNRGTGFSIAAHLEQADVTQWFKTIDMLLTKNEKSPARESGNDAATSKPIFDVPSRIFVTADTLTLATHSLDNVVLTAKQTDNDWLLDIDAPQARGVVRVNSDLMAQGIDINADYLSLEKPDETALSVAVDILSETADTPYELDPATLPPIYFYCKSCRVHNIDLGEVTLDTAKTKNGLQIRQLQVRSSEANINATGDWLRASGSVQTTLTGTLDSPDVGLMLKQYGISSGIKDSSADVAFNVNWASSPMDFKLGGLNGDVEWSLSDGYLTELSDKGSRIFTLFSLNSLVRKLSLDFRDVFAKGFFYDDMSGTLQITDGRAFTDDTEIDGGAGEIVINGYTDLNSGGLNYNVSFAPNVTGNLPFLVYFLATPPTALAALAIDQVLTSAKVISNVNYHVSGTISDPSFTEVQRDSKDISLPASHSPVPGDNEETPLTENDIKRFNMEVIDG